MTSNLSYELLVNGSVFKAVNQIYIDKVGIIFWPILFLFTLVIIAIKTESSNYVLFYTVLGNYMIGKYISGFFHPIFYIMAVLSLFVVLWKMYASKKV